MILTESGCWGFQRSGPNPGWTRSRCCSVFCEHKTTDFIHLRRKSKTNTKPKNTESTHISLRCGRLANSASGNVRNLLWLRSLRREKTAIKEEENPCHPTEARRNSRDKTLVHFQHYFCTYLMIQKGVFCSDAIISKTTLIMNLLCIEKNFIFTYTTLISDFNNNPIKWIHLLDDS